jgi:precorrin-6B methylase 1
MMNGATAKAHSPPEITHIVFRTGYKEGKPTVVVEYLGSDTEEIYNNVVRVVKNYPTQLTHVIKWEGIPKEVFLTR